MPAGRTKLYAEDLIICPEGLILIACAAFVMISDYCACDCAQTPFGLCFRNGLELGREFLVEGKRELWVCRSRPLCRHYGSGAYRTSDKKNRRTFAIRRKYGSSWLQHYNYCFESGCRQRITD